MMIAALGLTAAALDMPAAPSPGFRSDGRHLIDVWETEDGLPQNSVIAITQTRDGYLWLGTLNGLVRFDGSRFTVFDESTTPELGSSRIVSLFEDHGGELWIGTETAGIARLHAGRVTPLGIGEGSRGGRLMSACQDKLGAVWLYTADGQVWRDHNGVTNSFSFAADRPSQCRVIAADKAGSLWIGSDGRLSELDPTAALRPPVLPIVTNEPVGRVDFLLASAGGGYWRMADGRTQLWRARQLVRDLGPYPWGYTPVSSACEDSAGNLIVGTLGAGLFWYDAEGKADNLSTNEGLSHNYVLSLCHDREGNLWVGTDGGGLDRVKRQYFTVLEASRGQVVQSVYEDAEGDLWFGTTAEGIGRWHDATLRRYGIGQGLIDRSVRAVFVDQRQQLWVGTWGTWGPGLFQLQGDRFQRVLAADAIAPIVQAIFEDRRGRLWVGTAGGLAVRESDGRWRAYTARDGLSSDMVRAIADDAEGNIWAGTVGGGLNRLRDGRFTVLRKADGLPNDNVSSLLMDADGVLWIATDGGGLARLHDGKWTRYSKREGLVSNSTGYLIEDGLGNLWIGSNAGLMRVPKKALNDFARGLTNFIPCRAYGTADGLPSGECTLGSQPGAWRARDGRLWFPTIKGLVSVNPAQLKPNLFPPPVRIEAVLIDGQTQTTNPLVAGSLESLTIPADKEHLEIQFTALNLAAPDRARFRYRLQGHETAWIDAGDSRVARYSKLPPGQYQFHVKASNEDGVWNETGASLAIIVRPPFWRTWWFLTGSTLFLLTAIVASVHRASTQRLKRQVERMRQQEALERERARIARDLHDQLGASLTQVSLLGEMVEGDKASPADVEAHARQITRTARETTHVLDEIVWAVNPSNDTLDSLITYVCKYAQDYLAVAGLRYRIDVPADLPATPIPPDVRHNVFLAAKEAITNVVRHAHATEGQVHLRLEPHQFTLEIADNGRGVAGLDLDAPRTRNGLRNMRRRLEEIGGCFFIAPGPDGGAVVRLTAPLGTPRQSPFDPHTEAG